MSDYVNEEFKSSKCASSPEEIAAGLKKAEAGYENIDILHLQPGDIVVGYFDWNKIDIETVRQIHNCLANILPETVGFASLPIDYCVEAYDEDIYIKTMLDSMDQNLGRRKFIDVLRTELDRIDGDDLK